MTEDARLLSYVQRLENLQEQKDEISADMAEVRKELKADGYDAKAVARLLKRRKLDREEQQEQDALDATYRRALGMIADLPLGQSAMDRATGPKGGERSRPAPEAETHEEIKGEVGKEGEGWGGVTPETAQAIGSAISIRDSDKLIDPRVAPDRLSSSLDSLRSQMRDSGQRAGA